VSRLSLLPHPLAASPATTGESEEGPRGDTELAAEAPIAGGHSRRPAGRQAAGGRPHRGLRFPPSLVHGTGFIPARGTASPLFCPTSPPPPGEPGGSEWLRGRLAAGGADPPPSILAPGTGL